MPCEFCGKDIANKGSLKAHEICCKKNPNRVKHRVSENCGKFIKSNVPWNKGAKTGKLAKWDILFPIESVLVENCKYSRRSLKARLVELGLLEYKCACCGTGPEWCGKPMPLILDHINGKNDDNRLENLRFVCSNCDSQLPTYKSKNRKRVEKSPEE